MPNYWLPLTVLVRVIEQIRDVAHSPLIASSHDPIVHSGWLLPQLLQGLRHYMYVWTTQILLYLASLSLGDVTAT
jgi:hypothetical protein